MSSSPCAPSTGYRRNASARPTSSWPSSTFTDLFRVGLAELRGAFTATLPALFG